MVQESIGIDRNAVKWLAEVLPMTNHHVCTRHDISTATYGGTHQPLNRIEQGNSMPRKMCRDTSCLIFKFLENMKLGDCIDKLLTRQALHRLAIVFADDADFYSSRERFKEMMQEIIDLHTCICKATGGKTQQQKIMHYC